MSLKHVDPKSFNKAPSSKLVVLLLEPAQTKGSREFWCGRGLVVNPKLKALTARAQSFCLGG